MALLGLVELALLNVLETELYGVVTVLLLGLELRNDAGARLDDGAGDDLAVGVEDLGHADLLADDRFVRHSVFSSLKGYWLTAFGRQHDLAARKRG